MRSLGFGTLFSLACIGFVACAGDQGPRGDTCPKGDPGTPDVTTGTLAGRITDGIAGDVLAGVTVTAADAGGTTMATATTGADGKFSLTVTAGAVDLCWNYFLIEGDQSKGLHNPSLVNAVLNASLRKDLSN